MNGLLKHEKLAYTVEEVCELISLSRAKVYRLMDLGELQSIVIGRCRRITVTQLTAFLEAKERSSKSLPQSVFEVAFGVSTPQKSRRNK
ncbi:MAG TPA: helix-turn-helix domain-containing protein [Fimbriimonadaceae bacterium]|jgi:excisionase family DNA binding protein